MATVNIEAIEAPWDDVMAHESDTNWCLFGYADKTTLEFVAKGAGGLPECIETIDEDKIMFGGFRCFAVDRKVQDDSMTGGEEAERVAGHLSEKRNTSGTTESRRAKFVFFTFVSENAPAMQKGRISGQIVDIKNAFRAYHIDFRVEEKAELSAEEIAMKLLQVGGAHKPIEYDFGGGTIISTASFKNMANT